MAENKLETRALTAGINLVVSILERLGQRLSTLGHNAPPLFDDAVRDPCTEQGKGKREE